MFDSTTVQSTRTFLPFSIPASFGNAHQLSVDLLQRFELHGFDVCC